MTIRKPLAGLLIRVVFGGMLVVLPVLAQSQTFCAPPSPTPSDTPPAPPDNPPSCGQPECQSCTASPCFASTGVYTTAATDLQIPTNGLPLGLTRSYESSRIFDGPLGYGWRSNLGARLYHATYLFTAPSTYVKEAVLVMPNGETYRYRENADGSFTPPTGRRDTLAKLADGMFQLTLQRSNVRYTFTAAGALATMKDEYGNTLRFSHDAAGRVTGVADESGTGRSLTVTWTPAGRISSVQDNAGRTVTYSYGANGTLTGVTNPASQTTTYAYQQRRLAPHIIQIRDHWNRTVTDVAWDSQDRVSTYTEGGESYTMTYATPALAQKTHSKGTQSVSMDSAGLVTSRGDSSRTYNADGDLLSITDARGATTSYTYTSGGRIATVALPVWPAAVIHYTYDPTYPNKVAKMEPRASTSPSAHYNGNFLGWRFTYYTPSDTAAGSLPGALKQIDRLAFQDGTGNVLTQDGDPVSLYAQFSYDSKGRVTRNWTRTEGETTYGYDDAARVTYETRASNGSVGSRITTTTFDSLGRRISVSDPLGNVTTYEYDSLDRVTKVTLPKPSPTSAANFVVNVTYDNYSATTGLLYTYVTDPNGHVIKEGYDPFGRLIESVDALGNITRLAYAEGMLASITDPNHNVTSYAYNANRQRQSTTFPDGTTETYSYYPDGVVRTKTDRKGVTTTYSYDGLGRVIEAATGTKTIHWTHVGEKLISVTDNHSGTSETTTFTHDPKTFLVTSETQGPRGTLNYTWYTSNDWLHTYKTTDSTGPRTPPANTYTYWPDGSVKNIHWDHVTGSFAYSYDGNGQRTNVSFPNGQTRAYTYDNLGRLTKIANTRSSNIATFEYEYDKDNATGALTVLGQRTKSTAYVPSISTLPVVTEYFYDANYRLVRTINNGSTQRSWTYDAIGNRLTQTVGGSTTSYTYVQNGAGKNTTRLATIGGSAVTYDPNGNTTLIQSVGYTWDALNRVASRNTGSVHNFKYDYQHRRVGIDHQSTKYIYRGLDPVTIAYTKSSTYYQADYLYGPGLDEPLSRVDHLGPTYYAVDGLGSVVALTDAQGNVKNKYSYGAWGEPQVMNESVVQPFTFTGRETAVLDPGTLETRYYYRARYMDPAVGRFLSEDPQRFNEGINFYAYVHNDPVNATDPSGMQYACTIGDWQPAGIQFQPAGTYTKWKLAYETEYGIPLPVAPGGAPAAGWGAPTGGMDWLGFGWCKCMYEIAGAVRRVNIFWKYKRWRSCPPCGGLTWENRNNYAGFMYEQADSIYSANQAPQHKRSAPCGLCPPELAQ